MTDPIIHVKNLRASAGMAKNSGIIFSLALFLMPGFLLAQNDTVEKAMRSFHQSLAKNDVAAVKKQIHPQLTYGHSNGWLESHDDMIRDLQTGYLVYESYKEDSLKSTVLDNVAWVRFIADIRASMNKAPAANSHLKVVEVWVREKDQWLLLVRQAVK